MHNDSRVNQIAAQRPLRALRRKDWLSVRQRGPAASTGAPRDPPTWRSPPRTIMPTEPYKPIIFISYAHADEPEKPAEGEMKWLSFVTGYLRPAVKHGAVDDGAANFPQMGRWNRRGHAQIRDDHRRGHRSRHRIRRRSFHLALSRQRRPQ
jgi:hypothetical protein